MPFSYINVSEIWFHNLLQGQQKTSRDPIPNLLHIYIKFPAIPQVKTLIAFLIKLLHFCHFLKINWSRKYKSVWQCLRDPRTAENRRLVRGIRSVYICFISWGDYRHHRPSLWTVTWEKSLPANGDRSMYTSWLPPDCEHFHLSQVLGIPVSFIMMAERSLDLAGVYS